MRTRHHRLTAAAALTAAVSLALVGCGGDTTDDSPATGQTTTAGSSPAALAQALSPDEVEAADPTSGPADSSPKGEQSGDTAEWPQLVVSEIRVGDYQGKDRVVFELDGRGTPGYAVDYVDQPVQQGSGFAVDVPGESFLQVTLFDQVLPTETDLVEVPVGTVTTDDSTEVTGVAFTGQFEGQSRSVIGLEGTGRDFSTFLLENPTRLVVDIER